MAALRRAASAAVARSAAACTHIDKQVLCMPPLRARCTCNSGATAPATYATHVRDERDCTRDSKTAPAITAADEGVPRAILAPSGRETARPVRANARSANCAHAAALAGRGVPSSTSAPAARARQAAPAARAHVRSASHHTRERPPTGACCVRSSCGRARHSTGTRRLQAPHHTARRETAPAVGPRKRHKPASRQR